jgi:hypothetical protein
MKSENNTLFLVFDPETGILRDVMMLNNTVSGAGCFSDLQTEWATDFGEVILGYEQLIMDIFNGDVTIDFSHLATNIKIGLTSFINSAMISLEIANNLFNLKDSPFNILGVCLMNSRIDVYKDSIGDSWSPVTLHIELGYDSTTWDIRANPKSMINSMKFEITWKLIVLGIVYGPGEAAAADAVLAWKIGVSGGIGLLIWDVLEGSYNQMVEDPWLQIRNNGKLVYVLYTVIPENNEDIVNRLLTIIYSPDIGVN